MLDYEKEHLIKVIEMYRNFPCLWDITDSQYRNKKARLAAYSILLKKYKKIDEEATHAILKKRIASLKSTCVKVIRKVLAARFKGEKYQPTLWYYNLLSQICLADMGIKCDDEYDALADRNSIITPLAKRPRRCKQEKENFYI
ncbi:uncharacterized protein LOC123691253 [Colias croceus]|uniref:uncharacterized protein LOC123691253 n=1 Tax=Colias crocea TaxID=72248 RepID=UPI001E281633|nr:uncharacterized protein LOC123691253 [Colias croceus]